MYSILTRKTLYPDLITEIKNAKEKIIIDAYIWINDEIGQNIANAILDTANNWVNIYIRKDLSASIFEHTPGRIPFFINKKDLIDKKENIRNSKYSFMTPRNLNKIGFHIYGRNNRPKIEKNNTFEKLNKHKNITITNLPFFNHWKLIIIDDISYIWWQCISNDYTKWIDYNIKVNDYEITKNIINQIKWKSIKYKNKDSFFLHNTFNKEKSIYYYMKNFIDNVKDNEELIIEMAYFWMRFIDIIKKALARWVKVTILASRLSDTGQSTNMRFLYRLLRTRNKWLSIYLSDDMIHTKWLVTKKSLLIWAANFHSANWYFKSLNEQNIISNNKKLVNSMLLYFKKDIEKSTKINNIMELPKRNKFSAIIEIISVYI